MTGDLVSGFGLPPRFTTIVVGRRSQFLLADTRSFFSSRTFVVVHAACFSYATGSGSVLGTDWLQETSTHVSVCEIPTQCNPVCGLGGVLPLQVCNGLPLARSTHAEVEHEVMQ